MEILSVLAHMLNNNKFESRALKDKFQSSRVSAPARTQKQTNVFKARLLGGRNIC